MTATAPTWEDIYNDARAEMLIRRPDLTINEGDISDMLLSCIAAVGDRVVGYEADQVRATFVDGARGTELTKLANDHWAIVRFESIQALGSVTFTRTSSGAAGNIPAGTVIATQRDALGVEVQFATNALVAFGLADNGPHSIGVTAVLGGLAGNVQATKINRISSTLYDVFTVTNAAATLGGAEAESDPELRERIRTFTTTLRRGTLASLEYGALQVPQCKNARAVEDGLGVTTVYVTDATGASNAELVSLVEVELENWRAAGSIVVVSGGALFQINPISITLAVRAGVDTAAMAADVKEAIVERISRLLIGETAKREIIQQAALNVDLDNIIGVTVILPAADVVPTASQIIRTDVSFITVA